MSKKLDAVLQPLTDLEQEARPRNSADLIRDQIAFYGEAHGIDVSVEPEEGESCLLWQRGGKTLFYKPDSGEVGVMDTNDARRYSDTGLKRGQEDF